MAMHGPMRNELFKYRKRKKISLDGSISGVPYNPLRRSRRHVSGLPHTSGRPGYHHNSYMGGIPREYHPRLNSPSVDWAGYNSYESSQLSFACTPPIRTGPSRNFNRNASEMAGMLSIPSDDLALDELRSMMRGISSRPQERPIGMSADEFAFVHGEVRTNLDLRDDLNVRPLPDLSDITDTLGQLEKVLPQDHPDIIKLTNAADKLTGGQFSADRQASQTPESLSVAEDSYAIDPHEEAEQFFKQQMQILDKSFDLPVFESIESQAPEMFEDLEMFEQQPDEAFETESLEQIVEQEAPFETQSPEFFEMQADMTSMMPEPVGYDADIATDEINQAIDELSEQPMPQETEPDPFQPQYDPYMMGQNMFDETQYMADPFAMPGSYGPMGPMSGP
ncbi:MAG: hypothetical protein GY845_23950 [Planctomycetes bacterium]|nr:hypothetical protein [Planctomycetota bacterium]